MTFWKKTNEVDTKQNHREKVSVSDLYKKEILDTRVIVADLVRNQNRKVRVEVLKKVSSFGS